MGRPNKSLHQIPSETAAQSETQQQSDLGDHQESETANLSLDHLGTIFGRLSFLEDQHKTVDYETDSDSQSDDVADGLHVIIRFEKSLF